MKFSLVKINIATVSLVKLSEYHLWKSITLIRHTSFKAYVQGDQILVDKDENVKKYKQWFEI